MILPRTPVPSAASLIRASVAELGADVPQHEFWLFTSRERRLAIEQELAAEGIRTRLHSAFKPLVSELLEQRPRIEAAALAEPGERPPEFKVEYPIHAAAVDNRFRLEAYPLARLVQQWWPGSSVTWTGRSVESPTDLAYRVSVRWGAELVFDTFAPNRLVDLADRQPLTPCGWWRATAIDGTVLRNEPWRSDFEILYQVAMEAVTKQGFEGKGPHFDRLLIEIEHDGIEQRLPVGHDRLDTAEAMHEELYFSLIEHFSRVANLPDGSRQLQPGQIVPVVRNVVGGPNTVRVSATPCRSYSLDDQPSGRVLTADELAQLDRAPSAADVAATLLQMPGERYTATTLQGRQVHGILRRGTLPTVVINGGQHANENSGVIGALRATYELLDNPDAAVGLVALENPDGYALHNELGAVHPEHMNHAARYSALGDDLEFRSQEAPLESAVRRQLLADSGAQLFVNLHGYPAHEWVRPLTGYLPQKFEWWAVPQGFILIARYQPGNADLAESLLREVARELQVQLPKLAAFNQEQLATYEAHAGKLLFPLEGAIPLVLSEARQQGPTIQMITEFPDETVHDDDLRLAHETQFRAAVIAARLWWQLLRGAGALAGG